MSAGSFRISKETAVGRVTLVALVSRFLLTFDNQSPQLASYGSRTRMLPSLARLEDRPRDGQRSGGLTDLEHISPTNISYRATKSPKKKSTFLSMTSGVISVTPKAALSAPPPS